MMFIKSALTALLFVVMTGVQAQLNMSYKSNLDYDETINDVWGYVAPDGVEYALVGTNLGFSIVSLENPANPQELHFIPGVETVWRDIKTWGDFAYVVSDNSGEGMLIVDMTNLRDTVIYKYWQDPIEGLGQQSLSSCHNIFIDEYGLLYFSGSNLGAIVAMDVKEDPWNPKFVVQTPGPYSHDVYVRDSIVYTSEIYDGRFFAYDISDINNIVLLGGANTPYNFTHNTWLSDDSKTLFTSDERANAFIGSYDISDWSNVRELDRFIPAQTAGENVIPHNVHVLDDYLIISYYTDGVIVVDGSRPDNLIEVGNYDTFLGGNGGFSGAWGAYPFLPSGLVLVSDRQSGLYVLEPNYVRGCFVEGVVTNAATQNGILNSEIDILSDEKILTESTDNNGNYKTGKAISGTYRVVASHPEFYPDTVEAVFQNGVVTTLNFQLEPKPRFDFRGRVLRESSGDPLDMAWVLIENDQFSHLTWVGDSTGTFEILDVIEGEYRLFAGFWGDYRLDTIEVLQDITDTDIFTKRGYYDDYRFDYGWSESGTATNGNWVKDVPRGGSFQGAQCSPWADVPDDIGDEAIVTGNNGGNTFFDSVEDGYTIASSPFMELAELEDVRLSFNPWLCVADPDLTAFTVLASNGTDTVVVDTIEASVEPGGLWRNTVEYVLSDFLTMTDSVQVHFKAENEIGNNVVKAAVDKFLVEGTSTVSSVSDVELNMPEFRIYPNPASSDVTVELSGSDRSSVSRVSLVNNLGQVVQQVAWPLQSASLNLQMDLPAGIYFVMLESKSGILGTRKLVVN